jgi:Ca2+-binding EF-hand superfamily protein
MLMQQQPPTAGQDLPSDATSTAPSAASASTPTSATSADQFATDTLSSLLSAQEAPPSAANVASQVMSAVDTNGDGSLSLSEIETALGADTSSGADASPIASAISQAFSQIDTNGDGEISANELTNALQAQNQAQGAQQGPQGAHHHHHHAHGGGAPSSTDLASQLLGSADTDGDGTLSLSEIEGALGLSPTSSTTSTSSTASTDATTATAATMAAATPTSSSDALAALTTAFGQLDTNGDGKLSASELSTGIDAFMAAHHRGASEAQGQSAQTVTA